MLIKKSGDKFMPLECLLETSKPPLNSGLIQLCWSLSKLYLAPVRVPITLVHTCSNITAVSRMAQQCSSPAYRSELILNRNRTHLHILHKKTKDILAVSRCLCVHLLKGLQAQGAQRAPAGLRHLGQGMQFNLSLTAIFWGVGEYQGMKGVIEVSRDGTAPYHPLLW